LLRREPAQLDGVRRLGTKTQRRRAHEA
jgi:hypothetical protein